MLSREELEKSPFLQLILLLCLSLVSVCLFSAVGALLSASIYGFNPAEINNLGSSKVVDGMKLFQLFSALGLFIIPPIVYGVCRSKNHLKV